ncbi:MAG: hypothetical protein IJ399_02430 [Bacilli bacterium]|nr:hypothetical protein [Bacilli bacterium]
MKKVLFVILLFIPFFVDASIISVESSDKWILKNDIDFGEVYLTKDNEFIYVGYNKSEKKSKILKYDLNGNLLWKNILDDNNSSILFNSIDVDSNGDIYIAAQTLSNDNINNDYDGVVLKYDKNGKFIWDRKFVGNSFDVFGNILALEGGYIVFGLSTSTNINGIESNGETYSFGIRYDEDGNVLWKEKYDFYFDSTNVVFNDNRVFVFSEDTSEMYVIDLHGDVVNQISLELDNCESFLIDEEDNIIAFEKYLSNEGDTSSNIYTVKKIDKNGNLLWKTKISKENDIPYLDVVNTSNNGFMVFVGETVNVDKIKDARFILSAYKLNKDGKIEHQNVLYDYMSNNSILNVVNSVKDEYYVFINSKPNDKFKENGILSFKVSLDDSSKTVDEKKSNGLVYVLIGLVLIDVILLVVNLIQRKNNK